MVSENTTLTFDVDDVDNLADFCTFVESIIALYGSQVWIRRSSSGNGYHLKVVEGTRYDEELGQIVFIEKKMQPSDILKIRENTEGECRGRLKGDTARLHAGMNIGRLFQVKSNKVCGSWIPATSFISNPASI